MDNVINGKEITVSTDDPQEPITDVTPVDGPDDLHILISLLTEQVRLQSEQNEMLREAIAVLNQAGEKVEGLFGGSDGKPSGPGSMIAKVLFG